MSQNLAVTTTLPVCPTTEQFYETMRTLNPLVALVDTAGLDVLNNKITVGGRTPFFRKITKTFTNLALGALTNDIELFQLPAGGLIQALKLKHSAAFTGGTISAYTLSIGITGTLAKYMDAQNVFQAPSDAVLRVCWAPFFNSMKPTSGLPIGASYNQAEITALRDAFLALFGGAIGRESHVTPISIRLAALSTGGNLNLATAGSVDVWVLYSQLI